MRGTCPVCAEVWQVRIDGGLRLHVNPSGIGYCPGSGMAPRPHVHRCEECPATWDEEMAG